MTKVVEQLYWQ